MKRAPCPRTFTIVPADRSWYNPLQFVPEKLGGSKLCLTLLSEHSFKPVISKDFGVPPGWLKWLRPLATIGSLALSGTALSFSGLEAKEFELAALSNPVSAADPAQTASSSKSSSLSNGYFTRRKIHKYTSFATLPLLAAEAIVGQKLLNESNPEDSSLRSAHSGLAAGMGVLFGVETVTGVWNMLESRKISPAHKKHMFHGILMFAADAGFVATMATAPHRDDQGGLRTNNASTHKAIAYASIGTAAFSYLYMLFAK